MPATLRIGDVRSLLVRLEAKKKQDYCRRSGCVTPNANSRIAAFLGGAGYLLNGEHG